VIGLISLFVILLVSAYTGIVLYSEAKIPELFSMQQTVSEKSKYNEAKKYFDRYHFLLGISEKMYIVDPRFDPSQRSFVLFRMGIRKDPFVTLLCQRLLVRKEYGIRKGAAEYLMRYPDEKSLFALSEAWKSEKSIGMLMDLGGAIAEIGNRSSVEVIAAKNQGGDDLIDALCKVYIFSLTGDKKDSDAIKYLIQKSPERVKGFLVLVLGHIRDKKMVPLLNEIINSRADNLRDRAIKARNLLKHPE